MDALNRVGHQVSQAEFYQIIGPQNVCPWPRDVPSAHPAAGSDFKTQVGRIVGWTIARAPHQWTAEQAAMAPAYKPEKDYFLAR